MSNKIKLIKVIGYCLSFSVILFSIKYLAPNHEQLVLPVLFGTLLIITPLENYIKKTEKNKKNNLTLYWATYTLIIIGFLWSLISL